MLRRLRRLRHHIRYHSAPRRSSVWSRAMDVAFVASFLLSLPAALTADLMHQRSFAMIEVRGILARTSRGTIDAWLMNGQTGRAGAGGRSSPDAQDSIIGNFTLAVSDVRRGWPLVTTIARQPASLTIDVIAEPKPRDNVARDQFDPFQQQIESALQINDEDEALAAWNLGQPETRRQWWAWFPAVGAWWIMLFAAAGITIQTLRFGTLWIRGKRLERQYSRRSENKCAQCGYDLTGLEFNERCPECGSIVW